MFEKNLTNSLLLDFYGDILSDRQRDMLDMYYNEDLSLTEVAESFQISRQGARSVIKKGEEILNEMEEKLHLANRFMQMRIKSEEIAKKLLEINQSIEKKEIKEEISSLLSEIEDLSKL